MNIKTKAAVIALLIMLVFTVAIKLIITYTIECLIVMIGMLCVMLFYYLYKITLGILTDFKKD